jgi:hypothetical protein
MTCHSDLRRVFLSVKRGFSRQKCFRLSAAITAADGNAIDVPEGNCVVTK